MEWQPIDTAPKDGTTIDLWIMTQWGSFRLPDCKWGVSDWHRAGEEGWIFERRDDSEPHRDAWNDVCYVYGEENPTHWMPLPEPPK